MDQGGLEVRAGVAGDRPSFTLFFLSGSAEDEGNGNVTFAEVRRGWLLRPSSRFGCSTTQHVRQPSARRTAQQTQKLVKASNQAAWEQQD